MDEILDAYASFETAPFPPVGKLYSSSRVEPFTATTINGRVVTIGGGRQVTVRIYDDGVTEEQVAEQLEKDCRKYKAAKSNRRHRVDPERRRR